MESPEASEVRSPGGGGLGDRSEASSGFSDCVDGGGGDDFRVCGDGEEVLGGGECLELGGARIVQSESSGFGVGVEGAEIGSVLGESGAGSEIVKEFEFVSGSEEVEEASDDGVSGDFRAVGDLDEGDGVVEGENLGVEEAEDPEGGGDVFFVGDFVWGKIKNHPWWPGQIYDPLDASESATKRNHKGRFLVAFSDGSFAWCHSAQLKPFKDGFDEMLKQCNSKSFVSAVDNALNDIGRLVELEMTCPCVLKGNEEELDRPLADNTGIKEGVFIPERGSNMITEFEPAELIENLKNVAHDASVANMLDVLMLKSMLCAFYRAKGGYELPEYYSPQEIPGLEDKMEEGALDIVAHDGAVEVQVQGPFEEEMLSSKGESSLTCSPNFPGSRENQFQRRKQKSIAEIIAKEGSISDKLKSASKSGLKKRKAISEVSDGSDDTSVSIPMNESEDSEPLTTFMSKVVSANDENGSESRAKKRGRKKKRDSISSVVSANDENGSERGAKKRGRKTKRVSISSVVCANDENGSESGAKKRGRKKKIDSISSVVSANDENGSESGAKKRGRKKKIDSISSVVSANDENGSESGAKKRGRKKKRDYISGVTSANDENGSESGAKKRGRKKKRDSISSVQGKAVAENGHAKTELKVNTAESKEQNEKGYASRERKKSKYLCPPYTNPIQPPKKGEHETESKQDEGVAQIEKQMKSTAGHTLEFPIVKCSGVVTHTNLSEELGMEHDSLDSSIPDRIIIELPANDVLSEIRSVALFALRLEDTDIDRVAEFLYIYRSSTYLEGPNYQVYEQQQQQQKQLDEATKCVSSQKRRSRKRKSINSESMLLSERLNQNGHIDPESKSRERKKRKNRTPRSNTPKSRHAVVTPNHEANSESPGSTSLFVTFGPGSSLPTKSELIALYKKFGDLVETETDMFYNSFCARVVFTRASDAEKAFNSSQESSPFGTANVTFRLRNTIAASKTQLVNETTTPKITKTMTNSPAEEESNGWASQQSFIKEKLEMMTEMVEQSDGKMSPSLKSTLEGEMRGLLEKMNTMG